MSKKNELKDDLNKHNLVYVQHAVEEMKRLRHWFAGFEAADGKLLHLKQELVRYGRHTSF